MSLSEKCFCRFRDTAGKKAYFSNNLHVLFGTVFTSQKTTVVILCYFCEAAHSVPKTYDFVVVVVVLKLSSSPSVIFKEGQKS